MKVLQLRDVNLIYRSAESLSYKHLLGLGKSVINTYKALDNVSFDIDRGRVYGIIGSNGAGKSTLLRVLSGVMSPNSGNVIRDYNSINLLALGIGFSKELKGIDNIFLNGMLLGFSKQQIRDSLQEIIDYSELGEFIHRPMKTYSSGMVSKLGFSVAIHLRPEVLLIDEVLSVGDAKFRKKSLEAIMKIIKDKDTTVVMVSHNLAELKDICDEIIWLNRGKLIAKGDPADVMEMYAQFNSGTRNIQEIAKDMDSVTLDESQEGFSIYAKHYSVGLPASESKKFLRKPVDSIKTYASKAGSLQVTKRTLSNGDFFLFFEYSGKESSLEIQLDNVLEVSRYDHLYKKPQYDNRYGENKITGLYGFLDMANGSAVVSKIYNYRELKKKYDNDEASVIYELIDETDSIDIDTINSQIHISLGGKGKSDEKYNSFILFSREKLFRSRENLDEYMTHFYDALFNNCVWNSFFVTPSGSYTKLPYSIEPFTKEGYGYSLHHSSRKDLIPYFEQTKERFFEDFLENAILQAYMYQPQVKGLFLTAYTSTWLRKDTGIIAPYVDTRLNETFILMLQDFQKHVSWLADLEPLRDYADFFCTKYANGEQVYKLNDGIFFPDYFKNGSEVLAHTSLNHQLGIAQLLLKAWQKFNNDDYLEVFKVIVRFVENTCDKWVKPSGDLYYGIKQNAKGEFEFFGDDYIYVTLIDMLLTQVSSVEAGLDKSKHLDNLIESKLSYLETTEYNIFAHNPLKASGERADSVVLALKLLTKLGVHHQKNVQLLRFAEIEVTNNCNLSCSYCNTPTTSYPKGFISDDIFEKALPYLVPGQLLGFNGLGEPLLHENLVAYISQSTTKGIIPFLNTNGILLTEEKLDELYNAGLRKLIISSHNEECILAFRKAIDHFHAKGIALIRVDLTSNKVSETMEIALRLLEAQDRTTSFAVESAKRDFPHLLFFTEQHKWCNNTDSSSEEATKKRMSECKYVTRFECIMRWNGEFIACCRDTENTVKIGHIDNYNDIKQELSKYTCCKHCEK